MSRLRWLPVALLLCPNLACVVGSFTATQPFSRPPRPPGTVEVFRVGMPNHPYREVGILRVRSSIGFEAGLQKMMQTAADYGCDAIAGLSAGESETVSYGYYGAYSNQHDYLTASCLLWDQAAAPRAAAPPSVPPPTRSDE